MDLVNSIKYSSGVIPEIMESLHKISQEIFKNLSHALELPWEKYLGEMHEFAAPSKDRFRVVNSTDTIPNDWSTLVCSENTPPDMTQLAAYPATNTIILQTVAVNAASPETAFVIYGVALSVFSEGITPIPSSLDFGACSGYGDWLIYHVCPNDDVFYTRTAGALMTPLSCEEYESRKRVRELQFV